MPARTFDQILADVTARSDPQRQTVLSQIADLPTQQAAQEQSLGAQKDAAYEDILSGARQRGLGFSGIPLQEQAKYNATSYAPAVANLKSSFNGRRTNLDSALAQIGQNNYGQANDIYNQERNYYEQQRQFDEQMAAQERARSASASGGSGSALASLFGGTQPSQNSAASDLPGGMSRKVDPLGNLKGFAFTDKSGKPVSAATFASQNGISVGDLLYRMASEGDKTASTAYKWLRSIQGTDAFKSGAFKNTPAYKQTFSSIFWGS